MKTRIQELRKSKNLTQIALDMSIDSSQNTISRIELEETIPNADLLCKIADYFQTSVDYILYRSDQRYTWESHSHAADSRISVYAHKLQSLNDKNRNALITLIDTISDAENQR